jgi:hypothetical protein
LAVRITFWFFFENTSKSTVASRRMLWCNRVALLVTAKS